MELNFDELRELLTALNQTNISELTLKSDDFELTLRKPTPVVAADPSVLANAGAAIMPAPSYMPVPMAPLEAAAAPPTPPPGATAADSNLKEITSPMVGTFYRSPAPDEPPFVEVGDRISVGQTVCIIEAMKLMNELESEFSGEVVEVLVENAEPVEYGQPLMRVKPN